MNSISRPSKFSDIIGQENTKNRLKICIDACLKTGGVMPHILIDGPPGLGKTTIASALATELGVNLYVANAANLRSIKNILPYLMGISPRSVLFIDEIHRLPKIVEEFLYPVMEDFKLNITVENNIENIDIPLFTLVGATTSGGSLSQPLYDRFSLKEHLVFYTVDELSKLARSTAKKLGLLISDDDLLNISKRSKGTPRILNARMQWYANFAIANNDNKTVDEIFDMQGIDENGLDLYDRLYLDILQKNRGTPLGLKSISSLTGIAIETIENSIEPFLVRSGLVIRTSKGRIIGTRLVN